MLHKDAPNLDRAYDVIDSLISVPSGKFNIGSYGYGHSNRKAFDEHLEAACAQALEEGVYSYGHVKNITERLTAEGDVDTPLDEDAVQNPLPFPR